MAFSLPLFCFFSVVSTLSLPLSLSDEARSPEVEALLALKKELHDPNGIFNSWDENTAIPCAFDMITCSSDGTITVLGAPNEALSGKLSRAIANLTTLRTILLQNNNISGEIPLEIGSLSNLQTLDLSNNGFSGGVPSSLGHLKSLQYLRLNNNSLSGPIPASLANMSQLIFLDLSYNNLSGPMPRLPATTVNIMGNPLICGSEDAKWCSGQAIPVPVSSSVSSSPGKRCNILWLLWLGLIKVKSQLQLQWFY